MSLLGTADCTERYILLATYSGTVIKQTETDHNTKLTLYDIRPRKSKTVSKP